MTETAQMRTWAEISLDRLAHNYQTLRAMLAPDCRFLGLCKANAYGHGALQVGRKLEALGADMLAVACVDEAAELRRGGVTIPILCLGQTPPQQAELLLEHDVTQTVSDLETGRALARAAQAAGRTLKIHVKVDTGMTRLGFLCDEAHMTQSAQEITEAVISVPAYFNDLARNATKNAGELAGFHVERIINEPSAASLYYQCRSQMEDAVMLVFDFGGGTLDVSLVECFDNIVEILAVSGDNHLGGSDFDRLIADMFWKSCGLSENRFSAEDAAIVLERAENCKFELTGQETAQMCVTLAGREYRM